MSQSFSLKAVISAVDRVTGPMKSINRALQLPVKTMQAVSRASGNLGRDLSMALGPMSGLAGVAGFGAGAFGTASIIKTSAEFERFRSVLKTVEGSAEKAGASMKWVEDFTRKTPYQLAEVNEAFVQLRAAGLSPADGTLRSAGDAAAAMGKSMEQAVEAVIDAVRGKSERLDKLGIKGEKAGNKMVYRWRRNGEDMVTVAEANAESIQRAIVGIWNTKFQGAMDNLSSTWDGLWSNLMDSFTSFQKMIGDAGFFEAAKGELKALLGLFGQWESDGSLKAVARQISDVLTSSIRGLKNTLMTVNWQRVWEGMQRFGSSIQRCVDAVGGWGNALIGLALIMNAHVIVSVLQLAGAVVRLTAVLSVAIARVAAFVARLAFVKMASAFAVAINGIATAMGALNVAMWANPIGVVLAGIVAVVSAAWLLYDNWDAVCSWFLGIWDSMKMVVAGFRDFLSGVFSNDLAAMFEGVAALGKGLASLLNSIFAPFQWVFEKMGSLLDIGGRTEIEAALTESAEFRAMQQSHHDTSTGTSVLDAAASRNQVNGEIRVSFDNAPPGMRVSEGIPDRSGLLINPDVGYRRGAIV
ncbi:hypothetical protein HEQ69_10730 [Haematospirillum jordaniae]|uniref:tape measure protein n=1 Tax=Haematospirillum jordaniae TaxID=1549855 RepID=UPI00143299D9|nr:tape measure protein [Haematospirillum jordaniae]NKD46178.1 hypothetical protein [Haematospirillum jordaniae]NKD93071.1 hypothetical protein [Haematospirillum jordaniae]